MWEHISYRSGLVVEIFSSIQCLVPHEGVVWFLMATAIILEPILCALHRQGAVHSIQILVLAFSSVLLSIQLVGISERAKADQHKISYFHFCNPFVLDEEYAIEFCCILGGWCTIFKYPGVSVLRCFRVFRLLWLHKVKVVVESVELSLIPLFGGKFVANFINVLRFATLSLTTLGNEIFCLTSATRGGMLLMVLFFYSAFVLGMVLSIEVSDMRNHYEGDPTEIALLNRCATFPSCTFFMMKLSLFDGDALSFVYLLTENHKVLFVLLMAYLCITSFGILNGLVGIFGTAFASASESAFAAAQDKIEASPEIVEESKSDEVVANQFNSENGTVKVFESEGRPNSSLQNNRVVPQSMQVDQTHAVSASGAITEPVESYSNPQLCTAIIDEMNALRQSQFQLSQAVNMRGILLSNAMSDVGQLQEQLNCMSLKISQRYLVADDCMSSQGFATLPLPSDIVRILSEFHRPRMFKGENRKINQD